MCDKYARSRIENLSVSHHMSTLRRHGLPWITNDDEKVTVYHVLSATPLETIPDFLEWDLDLLHYDLRKEFKGFMAHAINLSEEF